MIAIINKNLFKVKEGYVITNDEEIKEPNILYIDTFQNKIRTSLSDITEYSSFYKYAKKIIATINFKIDNIPYAELSKVDRKYTKEQLRFIYDTAIHATLGELNHDDEFNRVLYFINTPKKLNLK